MEPDSSLLCPHEPATAPCSPSYSVSSNLTYRLSRNKSLPTFHCRVGNENVGLCRDDIRQNVAIHLIDGHPGVHHGPATGLQQEEDADTSMEQGATLFPLAPSGLWLTNGANWRHLGPSCTARAVADKRGQLAPLTSLLHCQSSG
jgi:hypothetical protein